MMPSLGNESKLTRTKLYKSNVETPIDRLRFYVYIISSLLVTSGIILHFFGILGFKQPILLAMSFCWGCSCAVLFALFVTQRIKTDTAFISLAIVSQAIEFVRILYLSSTHTIMRQQFYINEFICYTIPLLVAITFFYKASLLLTASNLLAIIIYSFFIPNIVNPMIITTFILADIALCTYCYISVTFVKQITSEKEEAKGKYNSFLSFMRMNDTEVTSLVKLMRTPFDDERSIDLLVAQLNDETKANLINIANRIENSRLAQEGKIKQHFPQFTPTELAVCLHVVAGHTQKEIARILNKSENNISTVRGNIRRKLRLEKTQDLREYLVKTIA